MTLRPLGSLHLQTIDAPAGRGAPVLCLHGLFAGAWVYDALLAVLAGRGFPASALSFRGHPPSPPGPAMGRHSIAAYCHDAAEAARLLDRPIVIGHSLGGLVAQMLVARNLARAAVLVSSAPPRGITVMTAQLLLRMPRYLPALLLSQAFKPSDGDLDALVLNCIPERDRRALRERLVADSGRAARQAALGVIEVPAGRPRSLRAARRRTPACRTLRRAATRGGGARTLPVRGTGLGDARLGDDRLDGGAAPRRA
jgi:pimeloyl-ACP methyl ester carboxylesterase